MRSPASLSFLISDFSFSRLLSDGRSTMLNTFLQIFSCGPEAIFSRRIDPAVPSPPPRGSRPPRAARGRHDAKVSARTAEPPPALARLRPRPVVDPRRAPPRLGRSLFTQTTRDNKSPPRPPRARDARGIDRAGEASRRRVSRGARRALAPSRATRCHRAPPALSRSPRLVSGRAHASVTAFRGVERTHDGDGCGFFFHGVRRGEPLHHPRGDRQGKLRRGVFRDG